VAVGPPPLRLPWLEWRPRGGSTRSGSGVAPPRSSPSPPPRGLPGQPGPNRAAARRRSRWLVELRSDPATSATWRVASGRAPLCPREPRSLMRRDLQAGGQGRCASNRPPWPGASAP
jgi:hypothetical protein